MKKYGMIFVLLTALLALAGCAHLAQGLAFVTENPEVEQVVSGLFGLLGGVPIAGSVVGFLAYLIELAKRKKECAKLAAIAAGVQDFLNNAKDKDIAEALKSAMRVQALGADLKDDIDKELAYLRQKGIIPPDTSNT